MCVSIFFSVKMTYLYTKRKQSIYILCPLQNHTYPKKKIIKKIVTFSHPKKLHENVKSKT